MDTSDRHKNFKLLQTYVIDPNLYVTPHTNINSNWSKDLNAGTKTLKHLEEKSLWLWVEQGFLRKDTETKNHKRKNNRSLNLIKI